MASISKAPNGTRTIQFIGVDGKRRSIRLGKMSSKMADAIKVRVEALNAAAISKCPIDGDTAAWVAGIGDDMADKLAAVGLIPGRKSARLGEFCDSYIKGRTDVKPRTEINLNATRRRLVEFFGAERDLREITQADADAFLIRLKERYADGTAGRTVKRAKQFFKAACRAKLLRENPFAEVKAPGQTNRARLHFVTLDVARQVLDACPDAEWRAIFALSRFGGLRCPSEHLGLRWTDVDWAKGRFRVNSPKKEHMDCGGERWVPIFPELRPHLEASFEQAPEGAEFVIGKTRDGGVNWRTQLLRIIQRAGLSPWPKLFHNLRASRETELAAEHPLHVVCAWIGNSAPVAAAHYLQVTDADFDRASQGGAKSGAVAVQKAVQSADGVKSPDMTGMKKALENKCFSQLLSQVVTSMQYCLLPPRGLEPLS